MLTLAQNTPLLLNSFIQHLIQSFTHFSPLLKHQIISSANENMDYIEKKTTTFQSKPYLSLYKILNFCKIYINFSNIKGPLLNQKL